MNKPRFCTLLFLFFSTLEMGYSDKIIKITLKEYLQKVRRNYINIKTSGKEVGVARARYWELKDQANAPFFAANYSLSQTTNRAFTSTSFFRNETRLSHSVTGTLGKRFLQTGTEFRLAYNYNIDDVTDQIFGSNSSYVNTGNQFSFGISQSLLRNGPIGWAGKKRLEASRNSVKLARSVFNSQLEMFLLNALKQYFFYELTKKIC